MELNPMYNGVTIEKSFTLVAFAQANGLPEFNQGVNKETGKPFNYLVFPNSPEGNLYCQFGASMQGMSLQDIVNQKDNIYVGLNSNGKYTCYKRNNVGTVINLW